MHKSRVVKWIGIGLALLGATLVAPILGSNPIAAMQAPAGGPTGELLYLNKGDIWRLDLQTNQQSLLIHPPTGIITRLAHSPDRRQIAYSVLYLDQLYHVLGADILVADAGGGNQETVVHEEELGYSVGWATWTSDPNKLIYVKENAGRGVQRIEEVDRATGERTLVVEDASSPAASPTQPNLIYETRSGIRSTVWSLDRTSDTRTELVKGDWFDDADNPSYSPDGKNLAFIAVGTGPITGQTIPSLLGSLFSLDPPVAAAHDMPGALFDLWVAVPDGSGLRRAAPLFDMQPEISWSPDGRSIAVMGVLQLQIVDVASGQRTSITRPNSSGQLSWGARSGS